MNATRTLGGLVLVFGLLLLLVGIAMPSTTTTTSQTCYNDPMGYGQECVESTYETSTNKFPILFFGLVTSVVGGVLLRSGSSDGAPGHDGAVGQSSDRRSPDRQSAGAESRPDRTAERGFAEQVREAKRDDDP